MTEQKQPIVLALGRGYNSFFCPDSRFHLIGVMKPQGIFPLATLTEDVKRGLRGGTLIDVNKVLTEADVAPNKTFNQHITSGEVKKALAVKQEEELKEAEKEPVPLDEQAGIMMSEEDIESATGKVLTAFIEKTEGLTLEVLGLSAKPRVEEMREALKVHFGYATASTEDKE